MRYEIHTTPTFDKWVAKVKNPMAAQAIAKRLDRAVLGNFGDVEPVGSGVSEMRIFVGKGYRLYFIVRGNIRIFMLCGGDKSSQQTDIKKAIELAKTL